MASRKTIEDDEPPVKKGEPIHIKYRPQRLNEVLGQPAITKSLRASLDGKATPHCFLFTGPAGTGKTTLAHIMARELGIGRDGLIEVDAASNSGIDDMRTLTQGLRYTGFGASPGKGIILNECQGLSKQAWDALLESTENPPPHVYYFFTSTNPEKIPKAVVTRCSAYHLNPLRYDDLLDLLEFVCGEEGYHPAKGVLEAVGQACEGSARQALTMLAKVHDCKDLAEAKLLLQSALDNAELIELARALVAGKLDWSEVVALLKNLDGQGVQPESIRLMLVNYLNACLMGSKSEKQTVRLLDMLECFMKPAHGPEKMAPLLLAFGRLLYP